jgi:hypothetical protein
MISLMLTIRRIIKQKGTSCLYNLFLSKLLRSRLFVVRVKPLHVGKNSTMQRVFSITKMIHQTFRSVKGVFALEFHAFFRSWDNLSRQFKPLHGFLRTGTVATLCFLQVTLISIKTCCECQMPRQHVKKFKSLLLCQLTIPYKSY